jgi:hypothetical protein
VCAQPPSITTISPLAIAPGQSLKVVTRGGRLAGATQLWTTFSDPAGLAADVAGNGQGEGDCSFSVTAPPNAALGIHGVRVLSPRGASPLAEFLVDDLPTVAEAGGNQSLATAQEVSALCGIDGRLDALTRDYFKLPVKAGQTISFEVFARRLGSPLDASVYLYDAAGHILAYCDDAEGLSSDPQLLHTFKTAGTCIVEVRDIRYQGGDQHFYRLRIGDFPCVNSASPLAVRRGQDTRVDFAGIGVADASPSQANVPADWPHAWFPVSTKRAAGSSSGFAMVAVVDDDEILEIEPNNTQPQAQRVTLGQSINGRFEAAGDVDRFSFTATQGQRFLFTGITRELGSPADLLLRMLDGTGNQISAVDDNGTSEGVMDVTFPANGDFTLEVADLNRRGGSQFAYRIGVVAWEPGFSLAASADTLSVPAGGIAALTVSAARRDYGGPIEVAVEGLPAGYSVPSTHLGPGVNHVVLTIAATKDAPPAPLTGIAIVGRATIGSKAFEARASATDALRARWSAAAMISPRFSKAIAVAASPPAPLTLQIDPPTVVFGKNLKATAKVIASRGEGMDEAIQLTINPPQDGLPPNVGLELKPIDKGQTETTITFSANENVQLGPFTVVVNGTHQKNNVATVATSPGIALRLEPPFAVNAAPMSQPALARGGQLKFKVSVQRNPAYAGEVKLSLEKLPAGVTGADSVLPAGQNEVEITLAAAADAPAASVSDTVLRAASPADPKIAATVNLPAFTIQ